MMDVSDLSELNTSVDFKVELLIDEMVIDSIN